MKAIRVTYNLENDLWSDKEYENQEDNEIEIPIWVLTEYIKDSTKLSMNEGVDLILTVKEVY
jgi:hypothetical protein